MLIGSCTLPVKCSCHYGAVMTEVPSLAPADFSTMKHLLRAFGHCFAGDDKWLMVSTDQLYGMAHSSDHATYSRRHHKSRLPPTLSSAPTSETIQCEVAFPGNRILSPSPAEDAEPKPGCLFDVHRTCVNNELTSEHSEPREISDKVPKVLTPSINDLHVVNTSTADSGCSESMSLRHSQMSENGKIDECSDSKSADICGIYVENGDHKALPLEPLKAEKLATFGNGIIAVIRYYYIC